MEFVESILVAQMVLMTPEESYHFKNIFQWANHHLDCLTEWKNHLCFLLLFYFPDGNKRSKRSLDEQ